MSSIGDHSEIRMPRKVIGVSDDYVGPICVVPLELPTFRCVQPSVSTPDLIAASFICFPVGSNCPPAPLHR